MAYVLLTRGHALAGDEVSYDTYGRLFVGGHWFWTTEPYGMACRAALGGAGTTLARHGAAQHG